MRLDSSSWRRAYLLALPALAVAGPWLSLSFPNPGGTYAFRVAGLLALVPLLIAWLTRKDGIGTPGKWLLATAVTAVGWGLLAQFWSEQPTLAISSTLSIAIPALIAFSYILAARQVRNGHLLARRGLAIAALVLWGFGAIQLLTGVALHGRGGGDWLYGDYVVGPFVNPNNYGVYLAACTIPFVAKIFFSTKAVPAALAVVSVSVSAYFISRTGSRSAILLLALIVVAILLSKLAKKPDTYLISCGVVGLIVIVVGRYVWLSNETLRFNYIASGEQASDAGRLSLTLRGLAYFHDTGGAGLGPGHFAVRAAREGFAVSNAHNVYIEVLAEFGFPLAFMMIGGAASVFCLWWNSYEEQSPSRPQFLIGETSASLVAVVVSGVATSSALAEPIWWMLIAMLAITVSAPRDGYCKPDTLPTFGATNGSR